MTSRERILQAVGRNQPALTTLPDLTTLAQIARVGFADGPAQRFRDVLASIGGQAVPVADWAEIEWLIRQQVGSDVRRITTLPELAAVADLDWVGLSAHALADVELAIVGAHLGVAEAGAVWLTESLLTHRATPFIPQHLAVVLREADIVPTMHDAYARIGSADYDFGVFVAGPSKTADIEQSLVLGAHGPKTMTVFLLP